MSPVFVNTPQSGHRPYLIPALVLLAAALVAVASTWLDPMLGFSPVSPLWAFPLAAAAGVLARVRRDRYSGTSGHFDSMLRRPMTHH